ncbi:MAG: hypothetical protein AAFR16_03750, partial [Pseudomonadota bacterium]
MASGVVLAYLAIFASIHFKLPPYQTVRSILEDAKAGLDQQIDPHHLFPVVYDRSGVTVADPDRVAPGVTLLTSYWEEFDWKPGVKILDREGEVLHSWPIDMHEIFGDEVGKYWGDYIHGTYLFENG